MFRIISDAPIAILLLAAALVLNSAASASEAAPAGEQGEVRKKGNDTELRVLLAQKLLRDGKTQQALNILEPLYRKDKDKDIIWQLLVTAYLQDGVPEKTLSLLRGRLEEGKGGRSELEALGRVYMEMGDIDSAEESWMRILGEGEENARYYDDVADLLWNAGRYGRAIEILREGAEYERFYGSYMKKIVRWERLMNRSRDAFRDELARILNLKAPEVRNADRLVMIFAEAGSDTSMISQVDSLPGSAGAQNCIRPLIESVLYAAAGHPQRGLHFLGAARCRAKEQYISLISLLKLLSNRLQERELYQFHAAAIDIFISEYGENRIAPRFLLEKAELLFERGKIAGKGEMIEQAYELASQIDAHRFGKPYRDKAILLMAGIELEGRGRFRKAVEILRGNTWRQRKLRQDGFSIMARALALCRECPGAEEELEAMSENGNVAVASEAAFRLAELLLYSGSYEEAAGKFAEAAEKNPKSPDSNDALGLAIAIKKGLREEGAPVLKAIGAALYQERAGNHLAAADSLDRVSDDFPRSALAPYAALWSSTLRIEEGRAGEARRRLESVCEDYPNSIYAPRAMEQLADIVAEENPADALELFRTAMNRYPDDPYIDRIRSKSVRLRRRLDGVEKGGGSER